jgi:pimeloyl-ACP methyl ester carboxylesterase
MLVIALLICLISAAGSSVVKSEGGAVTVEQLKWETPSGLMQAAELYIPKAATNETPAPAIVVVHGWSSTLEMQAPNAVELSRRGYVVLDIDMFGHGDSSDVPINSWWNDEYDANGVYDGVKMLATVPFVDTSKIGIEGHSNGCYASNIAVVEDNKTAKPLISSVFLESCDPIYTSTPYTQYYASYFNAADTAFANVYGNRSVGLVAAKYDEVVDRIHYPNGTLTKPADYINQPQAQSFLNFGKDPTGLEKRNSDTMYTENIDGKDAVRVVDTPNVDHPWGIMDSDVVNDCVAFFQKTILVPNPIAPDNQIWQWKDFFETIGIIGFFMFFVNFILVLLKTRFFGVLKAQESVLPAEATRKGKKWLWGGLITSVIVSAVSYPVIYVVSILTQPAFFNQEQPYVLGVWSVFMGLVTLLILFLNYRRYSKANGLNLREQGVFLSKDKIWKTILLGVLTAACTYFIVFLTNYFFGTDFRFWFFFTLRAFDAVKFSEILKFLPFFVFFFVINSIAMNVFNFIKIGKKEWVNTLLMAIFNTLGPILVLVVFYSYFISNGLMPTDSLKWGLGSIVFWLYPTVAVLPLATVLSRIIYKATRNPYLPSIAFSLIITIMLCTNDLTYLIK